jgi:hypothetical protein
MNESTPLPVIANVSRIVTKVVDRIAFDRSDYPLMVAAAAVEALKCHSIEARVMYGEAAWIEVMENQAIQWSGCWNGSIYFWVATQYGELVDLNASVAYKKRAHSEPDKKPTGSPPILWSSEVPAFYRYIPEGVAELELHDEKDRARFDVILAEIREKCRPELLQGTDEEFPNEPVLCPGRKLLDDSKNSFRFFDRTLAVTGVPQAPI